MGAFLQFLLFLLLFFVIGIAIVGYKIYRKIHDAAEMFRNQTGAGTGQQQHSANSGYNESQDGVIDNRKPEEANRKIFSKKEGEYVDFKEIKEDE